MDIDLQTVAFILMVLFLACLLFVIAKLAGVECTEKITESESKECC